MSKIDVGKGYDTLAAAMEDEGIFQVRWHGVNWGFTVELTDGKIGGGKTIREAIEDARAWEIAA